MSLVDQAVFTSAETERAAGYQVVATSPGVSEDENRALSSWGPSHGSLLKSGTQASSVNFHPLPGGRYCISRTTASGSEYSGRGPRIYTQCLLVKPDTFRQFANNPFSLIRAASASGLLTQHARVPRTLEPVPIVGRAPAVDPSLLSRSRRDLGARPVARLLEAALTCTSMAITGPTAGEQAVAVLLNCLPPQIRPEFSFSTGLRTSSRRPFRLLALGDNREEMRRAKSVPDLTLVDLSNREAKDFTPTVAWARAMCRILETGRTSLLSRCYADHAHELSVDELDEMGTVLLEELAASSGRGSDQRTTIPSAIASFAEQYRNARTDSEDSTESKSSPIRGAAHQQAHAAHLRHQKQTADQPATSPASAAGPIVDEPEQLAGLEALDDLVYAAIKGSDQALAELRRRWPLAKAELDQTALSQSREQYLRHALHVWEQCVGVDGIRPTDRAVNALDVLCLLFDEV